MLDALARESPDELDRVLDLGDRLREAQERGDRDRLRDLTTERRTLLAEAARAAAALAEDAGQHVGDGVLDEVQRTLQAALASEEVAAAVRTGRLVRTIDADGLDPVDPDDAVAGGVQVASPPRRRRAAAADDGRREEAAQRAKERLDAAKAHAAKTFSAARSADADAEDRARDAADLGRRLAELQERVDAAERAKRVAETAAKAAHEAADGAAAELDRLAREP